MKLNTLALVMGTRPEIIKMAPLYHALKARGQRPVVIHSGQHTDMAEPLYRLFDMVPDHTIDLKRSGDLASLGSHLLDKMDKVFRRIKPSLVAVHGDTSTAAMAALAAFYCQIPIAHIEAGLRSHEADNPFPEEMNRRLIAQMAQWHFAPTELAKQNLLGESVEASKIYVVGNTVVDAVRLGAQKSDAYRTDLMDHLSKDTGAKRLLLVTMHRRENQAHNIAPVAEAILKLLQTQPDLEVVWPVHPNPVVAETVSQVFAQSSGEHMNRLHLTPPLDYPVLLWVLKHAWLIVTDSGGIQEEAASLNTPVLVARETTERPEIIDAGAGILVGTEYADIITQVNALAADPALYAAMCNVENPYGDGHAAERICKVLLAQKGSVSHAA